MIFIPINFTFVCYIQFTNGCFLLFVLISVSVVDCVFLIISAGDTGVRGAYFSISLTKTVQYAFLSELLQ